MHKIINNLNVIQLLLKTKIDDNNLPIIIAVSKTFPMPQIIPLLDHGHKHFGENKIQESIEKWINIKEDYAEIKLHMIGKIQTNKVKFLLPLFDYIHSLDNIKLAKKISLEQIKHNKKPKIFIQVNIGNETQKNGVDINDLKSFYTLCKEELNLNIIGLMCLPPIEDNSKSYFQQMKKLAESINVKELSMGMSGDYLEAIKNNATYVRVGSKIFGSRT